MGAGSEKGQCYCLQVYLGGNCPSALPLMPETSVPPRMPLVPFKGLPLCWSPVVVSLSKSEEMPEDPKAFSTGLTSTGFYSQKLWRLTILVLEP